MSNKLSRRSALGRIAGSAAVVVVGSEIPHRLAAAETSAPMKLKGRINHSVSKWCFGNIPLDEFCQVCKDIGIQSIELLEMKDFPTLKKHGLTCAMVSGCPGGIANGLNRVENHDKIVAWMEQALPQVGEFGAPNVICMSGNRKGMSDDQGMENCVIGLKRIASLAEKHKVTVCMELLNSKRNHKDYMCDHTAWGAEVCKRVGSERIKLLYDIFHMQIMEGDLVDTIRENHQYLGHYHTGGVPGRAEIDETQEINYPVVMKAIVDTGYKGFVGQEFVPKRADKLASLRQAVQICDV
jgi:hydroxypyruvate isomerase